ncbi:MAG: MBL fold metallo-hydrolase, partial [Verrucomicrobiia bacterium]
ERLEPLELERLAKLLNLQSVGLNAVASEAYPLPEISGLPFCLYPLRMSHGIGVANAYLVADCSQDWGILFDTGTGAEGLWKSWPTKINRVAAVFLTHYETEHCGG